MLRKLSVVCLVLAVLCVVGCDGGAKGRVAISGKVTFNGEPIEKGSITFLPAEGTQSPATGAGIENGVYTIPATKGAMPGSFTVQIEGFKIVKGMVPNLQGEMVEGDIRESILPAKYDATNHDPNVEHEVLTAEIQKGKNTIDFALTGETPAAE